jgi:ABC-2 type transport system ATP-binding protein
MLQVQDISKSYAGRLAVEALSFTLKPGEILGLLGPNGAGKTTAISMVSGIATPDRGHVTWSGHPMHGANAEAKRHIGVVPQELALYDRLTAFDNAMTFGALYGLPRETLKPRVQEALRLVGLDDRAQDKPATFSGGMKRRLNLACALVHDPDVLLLDEPTVGVDPQSRNAIFENLETLKSRGKAIVYTTHYMEEAERLCDRVMIVDAGKVIAEDALALLKARRAASATVHIELDAPLEGSLPPGIERESATRVTLRVSAIERDLPAALSALAARGVRVTGIETERDSLETLFLELTGRALRDA